MCKNVRYTLGKTLNKIRWSWWLNLKVTLLVQSDIVHVFSRAHSILHKVLESLAVRALCKFCAKFFCRIPPHSNFLEFLCDSNALFGLSVDLQNRKLFEFKVSRGYPKICSKKKRNRETPSEASPTVSKLGHDLAWTHGIHAV